MDDRLRQLFQRKAGDVSARREVPRPVVRRARRRIAMNAVGVTVIVAALAGGAFAGVQAFGASSNGEPSQGGHHTPSAAHSPAAPPHCTNGQLRAVGSMEGAAGSREGVITLTNFSDTTCTLKGTPKIDVVAQDSRQLSVVFVSSPPQWQADAKPKPAGWPVVTLKAFDAAQIRIRWSNWCPQGRAEPLWRVRIPGSGTVDVINGMDELGPPPCNGPGQPPTVEVGPFEPSSGA